MKISVTIKIIFAIFIAALIISMYLKISGLKQINEDISRNQKILVQQKNEALLENQKYKVADSLNAAKISQLQLTLEDYKAYSAEKLDIIEQLEIKKANLEKIISTHLNTINNLSLALQDSIKIDSLKMDTVKCFRHTSKWCDIDGCISPQGDSVDLQIKNRESLIIVETVIYKRFLGFLWKTRKVKDRQLDVVSENPYTVIIGLDYVEVEK